MGVNHSLCEGWHKLPHPCAAGSRARQEVTREVGPIQEQIQPVVPGKSFYF